MIRCMRLNTHAQCVVRPYCVTSLMVFVGVAAGTGVDAVVIFLPKMGFGRVVLHILKGLRRWPKLENLVRDRLVPVWCQMLTHAR